MKKEEKDIWDGVNFFGTTGVFKTPLTEEELKRKLEDDVSIIRKFENKGYITSKDYSFITRTTFDENYPGVLVNNSDGTKSEEQRNQAKKMCQIIEEYLNSYEPREPIKVVLIYRRDTECALYNANRFSYDKINKKLMEVFS